LDLEILMDRESSRFWIRHWVASKILSKSDFSSIEWSW